MRRTGPDGLLAYAINGAVTNVKQVAEINHSTATQTHDASAQRLATFRTTTVSMKYAHLIQYRQGGTPETGQTHFWLTRSGTELFPGSYSFQFQVPDRRLGTANAAYPGLQVDISGDSVNKTVAAVRLTDSAGAGLRSGTVTYYRNGAWTTPADNVTDGPGGTWIGLLDGPADRITYRLNYEGGVQTLPGQDLATAPVGYFQTLPVTLKLSDHEGNPLAGGNATFYGTSWRSFGETAADGTAVKELLPVKHSFRMNYLGSEETRTIDPVTRTPVEFRTGLLESGTNPVSTFYTKSWQTFPEGGVELLPGKVTVRFADGTPQTSVTVVAGDVVAAN